MPAVEIGGVSFAATATYTDGSKWCEDATVSSKNKRKRKIGPPGVTGSGLKVGGYGGRVMFFVLTVVGTPGFTLFDALADSFTVTCGGSTFSNCTLVNCQIKNSGIAVYNGATLHLTTVEVIVEQFAY